MSICSFTYLVMETKPVLVIYFFNQKNNGEIFLWVFNTFEAPNIKAFRHFHSIFFPHSTCDVNNVLFQNRSDCVTKYLIKWRIIL